MDNRKIKLIIGLSMLGVILLLGFYSFGDVRYSQSEGLSYEEKKRDAKYLMDFLENTYPYFEEVKDKTGEDILRNKGKKISSISKTKSDEDFYHRISTFLRKLPYGNAELSYNWEYFGNNYTYVDKELGLNYSTYREKTLKGKEKWQTVQANYWQRYVLQQNINFFYFDGNYYVISTQSAEAHVGDMLLKVDGIPVDEFVEKIPYDKYFTGFDYTLGKYIAVNFLDPSKDHGSKKIITLRNSQGEEKEVNLMTFDESKPMLEDGFSKSQATNYSDAQNEAMRKEMEDRKFLNLIVNSSTLALNFSAYMDIGSYYNESKKKETVFSSIDKSSTLILDLRGGYDEFMLLEVLSYISPKDLKQFDYRIFKKTIVTDEFIDSYESKRRESFTRITSPIKTLEKSYPISKYHIFEETLFDIKGKSNYNGKVFVLLDSLASSNSGMELINELIKSNIAIVISKDKFVIRDFHYDFQVSTLLPNSNLIIEVNCGKKVNENGELIDNKVVTPQVLIKKDVNSTLDKLKKGEGLYTEMSGENRYTVNDEYYNEVLKLK